MITIRYADSKEKILAGVVNDVKTNVEAHHLARIIAEQEDKVIEIVYPELPAPTLFTQEAMEVMGHIKKSLECLHCENNNNTCPNCGGETYKTGGEQGDGSQGYVNIWCTKCEWFTEKEITN